MCSPAVIPMVVGMMAAKAMQPSVPKAPPVPEVAQAAKKAEASSATPNQATKRGLSSTLLTGNRGLQTKALTQQNTMLGGNTKLGQ